MGCAEPSPASVCVYVGLDLIGDGLMKLPFVRALRHAFPGARITWLAGKGHSVYGGSLAPLVAGLIDEVIDDARIGTHAAEMLTRPMPDRAFDLVIDTQSRVLTTLILTRIRHRRFISGCGNYLLSDARPADPSRPRGMVLQLLKLVEAASGRPPEPFAPLTVAPEFHALAAQLLPAGPRYVGLAPGAGGVAKRWPLDRFVAVGRRLVDQGAVPVVFLGPAEAALVAPVRAQLPQAVLPLQALAAAPPLLTIALAMRLRAAVANDSGTGHLLAAGAVPLVSLFGPTPPEKFAPTTPRLTVIRAQDHGAPTMDAIPLATVAAALDALLAAPGDPP